SDRRRDHAQPAVSQSPCDRSDQGAGRSGARRRPAPSTADGRPRGLRPGRRVPLFDARQLRLGHGHPDRRRGYAGSPVTPEEETRVTGDQLVRELVDRFWEGLLRREPLMGTYVGDERFDDRLPDISETGRVEEETASRDALRELDAI